MDSRKRGLDESENNAAGANIKRASTPEETQKVDSICILSQIPTEIRWMIFDLVPDTIGEIKLVSKSYRSMIEEWMIPQNLPTLSYIRATEKDRDTVKIVIGIEKAVAACFYNLKDLFKVPIATYTGYNGARYFECAFEIAYATVTLPDSIIDRLRSSLGPSVKVLWIEQKHGENDAVVFFNSVLALTKNFKSIYDLQFLRSDMSDDSSNFLLNLASSVKIQWFTGMFKKSSLQNPRTFLLGIADFIKHINIGQLPQFRGAHYFLNAIDENWVTLIVEMFNRGTETIEFSTLTGTPHLNAGGVTQISEILVARDKAFAFTTTLSGDPPQRVAQGCAMEVTAVAFELGNPAHNKITVSFKRQYAEPPSSGQLFAQQEVHENLSAIFAHGP